MSNTPNFVRAGLTTLLVAAVSTVIAAEPMFSAKEKADIADYWKKSGRYVVEFANQNAPYEARQNAEGSLWLLNYAKKLSGSATKIIPGQEPLANNPRQKIWNEWIEAKYSYDEYLAARDAHTKNRSLGYSESFEVITPAYPGPCPDDLVDFNGAPPAFCIAAAIRSHQINFGDLQIIYQDNVKVRRKYAYYRFHEGVMDSGEQISRIGLQKVRPIFTKAGVDDSKLRVMAAVSLLEGGFDSINTYDTGFVSVGFLQFACLSNGSGSLGQVLLNTKKDTPDAFYQDFRRFGLDVTPQGQIVALNLNSMDENVGTDAAKTIINDRRLTAVFQRAGKICEAFRLAQVKTAMEMYYPANDPITVKLGNRTLTGKVSDVIKTEAGMATLMDRKVNTGNLGDLDRTIASLMATYNLKELKDVADVEQELIQAMVYRKNYLLNTSLTQPKPSNKSSKRNRKN